MALEEYPEPIKTGAFIDELGGLYPGELHLFYGPPAAGKTLGCLVISLHFLDTYPDRHVIYVDTESLDPRCRLLWKTAEKFGKLLGLEVLDRLHFFGFTAQQDFHEFLGGRARGKEKKLTVKELAKSYDIGLLVLDSITRFYAKEINNAPPPQKPQIAMRFAGKLMVWMAELGEIMKKPDIGPFPILATAWMKSSRVAQLLKKKTDAEEIDQHLDDTREFLGGKALAHSAKLIYRVLRNGDTISFTQIRGPNMGKTAKLKIEVRK